MLTGLKTRLPLAAAALLLGVTQAACQHNRTVSDPADPDWSYHDGQAQLSNNDLWETMIPASALLGPDVSKVASVEDHGDKSDD